MRQKNYYHHVVASVCVTKRQSLRFDIMVRRNRNTDVPVPTSHRNPLGGFFILFDIDRNHHRKRHYKSVEGFFGILMRVIRRGPSMHLLRAAPPDPTCRDRDGSLRQRRRGRFREERSIRQMSLHFIAMNAVMVAAKYYLQNNIIVSSEVVLTNHHCTPFFGVSNVFSPNDVL